MAKEIVTRVWCDNAANHEEDDQAPAQTFTVAFGNHKPKELDLCDVCSKQIVTPLLEMLEEHGQPVGASIPMAGKKRGPYKKKQAPEDALFEGAEGQQSMTCPTCQGSYTSRDSLREHMRKRHHQKIDGSPMGGDYECPDCDMTFAKPQGLGVHRRHMHGYVAADKVLGEA